MPRVSTDSTPFLEGGVMKVVHYQIGKRYNSANSDSDKKDIKKAPRHSQGAFFNYRSLQMI
jgi:hypothetical protein